MTFRERFDALVIPEDRSGKAIEQNLNEFLCFLEFAYGYFKAHGVERPIVVEIGISRGRQKCFYETLLNAEYIGMDIGQHVRIDRSSSRSGPIYPPDILGNSHAQATVELLKSRLAGRMIDLLFIDGDHTYQGVAVDYTLYAPLTKHIVAFHDISTERWKGNSVTETCEVKRLWGELVVQEKRHTVIEIRNYNDAVPFGHHQMGIGLVVKDAR